MKSKYFTYQLEDKTILNVKYIPETPNKIGGCLQCYLYNYCEQIPPIHPIHELCLKKGYYVNAKRELVLKKLK